MNDLPLEEQVRILTSRLSHMQKINKDLRVNIMTERARNNMKIEQLENEVRFLTLLNESKVITPSKPTLKDYLLGFFKNRS